jgi:hypothetical protein
VDGTQEVHTTEFDVFLLDANDIDVAAKTPYINKLAENSLLSILQSKKAKRAFEKKETRESSLFHLFLT